MDEELNEDDYLPEYYKKPVLLLGCGNYLLGDDGFGSAVVEYLCKNHEIPNHVTILDVGTSSRTILFSLTIDKAHVKKIIIVDAVDLREDGRKPGEIFEIEIDDIPFVKKDDYSMHQVPTSNLLKELKDHTGLDVRVLVCQVEHIPDEVEEGLSEPVRNAIPGMCELILSDEDIANP